MIENGFKESIELFVKEDEIFKNLYYQTKLPSIEVECQLKFKDDMVISGLPFFYEVLRYFNFKNDELEGVFLSTEGNKVKKSDNFQISFKLPFNLVLSIERIGLNLLQRSCAISTYTNQCVEKAKNSGIKILDTRKTTPGHRSLEKYAVRIGGGFNHRLSQTDAWMIKDNHKNIFGGLKGAVEFFNDMQSFYSPLICEIHSVDELKEGIELGLKHFMLDNFSNAMIDEALPMKHPGMTFEMSGGIRLENLENYLRPGVDAISMGALTYDAPHKDISLKYHKA